MMSWFHFQMRRGSESNHQKLAGGEPPATQALSPSKLKISQSVAFQNAVLTGKLSEDNLQAQRNRDLLNPTYGLRVRSQSSCKYAFSEPLIV
ncbi:hypothetical protein IEQ34_009795 [Dendrobium chrysotoxum]|uniref:Uncharacterized protein n=1 Tax=Dendrobium chrysotoxum TaxID=161865 RepID=A0AAV7H1W4_DENCH|nr:hypothetical protein IEQ34_009795 [Dendrobium chrysotoxum]